MSKYFNVWIVEPSLVRVAVPPGTSNEAVSPSKRAFEDLPPPTKSSVSLYELSFGTTAGICAGVFVKKGAKMVAFAFGGVFVLLQVR